ncbi:MAG TPA: CBS domain-containing protein [Steroidobacteraceae bacterium]|nr:CBS domain-containing protein [Steroidobacteraceae bacterium]
MPAEIPAAACTAGSLCHPGISIEPQADIEVAAECMRQNHVGCLFVTEPASDGKTRHVTGVLTDRDIVIAVVARKAPPGSLKVADVMTRNPLLVRADCSLDATLSFMRDAGVRRVAVTKPDGELVGVLALDDLITRMAEQMLKIHDLLSNERGLEQVRRP